MSSNFYEKVSEEIWDLRCPYINIHEVTCASCKYTDCGNIGESIYLKVDIDMLIDFLEIVE